MAERSIATDCKSVAPVATKVRILASPPVLRIEVFDESCEVNEAGVPAEVRESDRGEHEGGSNSVVESQPSKLLVAGSIPVSRSISSLM